MNENSTFNGLGIAPAFLEILARNKFTTPTPIQAQSIPVGIEGKDIIGIAQTGTGKTLAFGIPMIQNLVKNKGKGLVIAPTRELALQIDESLQKIGRPIGLKTSVLIGGEDIRRQIKSLRANPHILIVTPGRLIDHLEQKTLKLSETKILVLDEADRMLEMGFAPQIERILAAVPTERQTMLFSATMPAEIVSIATSYMKLPVRVEVAKAGTTAKDVSQELFFVDKPNKPGLLAKLLAEYHGSVLVFTRTKFGAKRVAHTIRNLGHPASEIHSNRSLAQRKDALQGFKLGKYRILVATDIAARGIDVAGIELVINYDLPANAEDYVHRIGRTGRAGLVGHAISFAMPHEKQDVRAIERLIRIPLPVSQTPVIENVKASPKIFQRESPHQHPQRPHKPKFSGARQNYSRTGHSAKKSFKQPPKTSGYFPPDQGFDNFSMKPRSADQSKPFRKYRS